MWKSICIAIISVVVILSMSGCSGTGDTPTTPVSVPDEMAQVGSTDTQHVLWGTWEINFDENEIKFETIPIRNAHTHFNITNMVQPPNCDDCLEIGVNSFDPVTRIINADVTLRNRFGIPGRDVRGILFTNEAGHMLVNADEWTHLYDPVGGMDHNPFRAFAKTEPNRVFGGAAEHTETYLVYIPIPPAYASIRCAVEASWPGNCKEPYMIDNFTQDPIYEAAGASGGVWVDVYDWQDDVESVQISAYALDGFEWSPMAHGTGNTWVAVIINNEDVPVGDYDVWIKATTEGSGVVDLYDHFTITVSELPPATGWCRTWGADAGDDYARGVGIDDDGNIWVSGMFKGTVDFDPGPETTEFTSYDDDWDAYLSKFNPLGDHLWTGIWGGAGYDNAHALVVDGDAIYVTGWFWDKVDFDPGPGVTNEQTSYPHAYEIYVSKFNKAGEFQWVHRAGGDGHDQGYAIGVDASHYVYVGGYCRGYANLGDGEFAGFGGNDAFVLKLDPDGIFQWGKKWGSSGHDTTFGLGVDDLGVSVVGAYNLTVDFDPGDGVDEHTSAGDYDCFVTRFDPSGNHLWARTWGASGADYAYDCATDPAGNSYLCGNFEGTVDFDPDAVGVTEYASNGLDDAFLSRFDPDGKFEWAYAWGGTGDDQCNRVRLISPTSLYAYGSFQNTVDLDPGPLTNEHVSNGDYDVYLSRFNSDGELSWVRSFGGLERDVGMFVAPDPTGLCYITGYFSDTVDFNPDPVDEDNHTSAGGYDAFFCKIPQDGDW